MFSVVGQPGKVIAMFDVWHPSNHEESRYVWLPVEFSGDGLSVRWRDTWSVR